LKLRIIEDVQSLSALTDAWRRLQRAIRHPFQELGWYTAWARTIGMTEGRRLKVATLWEGSRLVAVWPLTLRRYKGVRLLEWVGARVTDYCDVIVDPAVDATYVLGLLWRELRRRVGFDVLRLGQVPNDAILNSFVNRLDHWVETDEMAYGAPVSWSNGADWLANRSARRRDHVRRRFRQMEKQGFELKVWRSAQSRVLDALIEQKQAWVRARHIDSFMTDPQGPEFVRAMAAEMATAGQLHLSAICSAERIVACHVGFVREGTFYYYLPTYDAAYAKQSFGSALRESLFMWACDQGLKKFDLLRGADGYKMQYDAVEDPVRTLVVPRGLLGRVATVYYRRSTTRAAARAAGQSRPRAATRGAGERPPESA